MTTTVIAPAAAKADDAQAAARAARLARNTGDAAYFLRRTGSADLAADITGLPRRFVLRVAAECAIPVSGEYGPVIPVITRHPATVTG